MICEKRFLLDNDHAQINNSVIEQDHTIIFQDKNP